MTARKTYVRELAGWGLDADEYRPAIYRGSPASARCLVAAMNSFEVRSALVKSDDCGLQERLRDQALRGDFRVEMAGLDWFLDVVDLRLLLAFQRRIVLDPEVQESPIPDGDDWDGLMNLSFGEPKPLTCDATWTESSVLLRSANPNMQFRITDDTSSPIAIDPGSPFFEVAQYRDRWFLRDGYHRAFRCLRAGVFYLPAVIVRARTLEELGAVRRWFFPEAILLSSTPPRIVDFLDDRLVIEYNRPALIKTLRLTWEETYSVQGEEL
jgi:hypothetical protein